MADFLWAQNRKIDVVDACEIAIASAALNFDREVHSAVDIQRMFRGFFVRARHALWHRCAKAVQRIFRGLEGRKKAMAVNRRKHTWETMAVFHYQATVVQKTFRGFYSRRYYHDFFARKTYIENILRKSILLRETLRSQREKQILDDAERREEAALGEFQKVTQNLHHLVSTASCAGIYASPYFHDNLPTAFGVPIEDHLRRSTKQLLRTQGLRSKRHRPKKQAISIQAQSPFDAMERASRQEARYSKLQRVSARDFIAGGTGGMPLKHIPGISNGTEYLGNFELAGTTSACGGDSAQKPFYTALPSNQLFD